MTPSIDIRGARELARAYDEMPALVASTAFSTMRRLAAMLQDYVVRRKLAGDPLNARTRNLARSIFHRVELNGSDIVGRVGVDLAKAKYGRLHELGGIVTPKGSVYLTIPVGQALTGSGVARFSAREFISATSHGGPGMRGFTRSFVNAAKTAIMGVRASGDVEPVFALKRRVTIPARPYLSTTLDENRDTIVRTLETGILAQVRAAAEKAT